MTTTYIDIDDQKWGAILIFDFDVEEDCDELEAIMDAFSMSPKSIDKSLRILSTPNSGMTVSSYGTRMSAVFIGTPTSTGQFWNTMAHESVHLAQAILDYYNETWEGETAAYLEGYIFQKIVEKIAIPCR